MTRAPASPPDLIPHRHADEQGTGHPGRDGAATMCSTSASSTANNSPVSHAGTTDAEKFRVGQGPAATHPPAVATTTTIPQTTLSSSSSSDPEKEMEQRVEDATVAAVSATAGTRTSVVVVAADPAPSDSERPRRAQHRMTNGRPDVATLIREAVRVVPRNRRVLVASCGPQSLMTVVRDTAAGLVRADGPAVELHCEQFGW